MSILQLRRRPSEQEIVAGTDDQVDEQATPVSSGQAQVISTLATKAATGVLWCALLLGPLGAGLASWALYQPSSPPPAPAAATVTAELDETAVAAEFAHRVVTAWLRASRTNPGELEALVENPAPLPLTPEAFTVEDVSTAGIISAGPGVWSVTVAATVTDESDERHRRYLQLPVMVAQESVTALSLPAVVSAPVVAKPPASTYRHQVTSTSPVTLSVTGFLAAYLTGSGDLSRYLTPGVELTPVNPEPFVDVDVVEVRSTISVDNSAEPADGQRLQVLVVASGTVAEAQTLTTSYALSLISRSGRWEVSALEAAPVQANQPLEPDQDSVMPPTQGGTPPTGG